MRRWAVTSLVAMLALGLLALPAAAQGDFYGEVLPREEIRPGDVTAPPDGEAPAPGVGEARPRAVDRAPARDARLGAAQDRVVVLGRQLPVTGFGLTVSLLLATALLAAGASVLAVSRRRARLVP